jgi:hypothetical protein
MDELIGTQHGDYHLRLDRKVVSRGNTRSADEQEDRLWYMFDCNLAELPQAEQNTRDKQLEAIAGEMAWENEPTDPSSDSRIPAGYTILGQFITHDLTFNTRPLDAGAVNDAPKGGGDRTPQLDLDSVYELSPRLAYPPPRVRTSAGAETARMLYRGSEDDTEPHDLPRYEDVKRPNDLAVYAEDKAIIGDVRNDDNILLSQLHLAFLKLHNQFVGYFGRKGVSDDKLFAKARQYCVWHYQWVIVNDYLPRIVGPEVIQSILALDEKTRRPTKSDFKLYRPPDGTLAPIPVEFSAAAFRFGHSMIRSLYRVNKAGIEYPLFGASKYDPRHLGGQRRLPAMLEVDWTRFFFEPPPREETGEKLDAGVQEHSFQPSHSQPLEESPASKRALAALDRAEHEAVEATTQAEEARTRAERAEARAAEAEGTAAAGRTRAIAARARAGADAAKAKIHEAEVLVRAQQARVKAEKARARAVTAEAIAKAAEARVEAPGTQLHATGSEVEAAEAEPEAHAADASTHATRVRFKADKARAEADEARAEADKARAEADKAATEQALAEVEAFSRFSGIFARKIDSHLTQILSTVPEAILPPDDRRSTKSLALRDLKRGDSLGLASGPAVVKAAQAREVPDVELLSNQRLGLEEIGLEDVEAPLWFYLLKEAELLEDGERLGPLGGRIVAEVILGVLDRDEESYFHKDFKPVVPIESKARGLTMADLLRFARELYPDED